MRGRFALSFPYLCGLLIVALMVWEHVDWPGHTPEAAAMADGNGVFRDPVCHMDVGTGIQATVDGAVHYFCTERCSELFVAAPADYLEATCLVCKSEGDRTPVVGAEFAATWQDTQYAFCSEAHRSDFREDPAGYFLHTMWGIPGWLYYVSIAVVLILSFGLIEWRTARTDATIAEVAPRIDLLHWPIAHRIVVHPFTRSFARLIVLIVFGIIIAAGLFGNQLPAKNIAPILTWTIWWGGLVVLILYAGKAWCYICPWETIADWAEGMRFWGPKKDGLGLGLKWPKVMRNVWPATFFFVALTWIELGFGVTMNPRVTAYLALGMVAMAFVCAFLFERKAFCRYGCLVGRVSGLYALFSPIEVRARDREACRTCDTQSCYKGNEHGEPCPTGQYLPTMDQSTYCISCMECAKSCEKDNVAVRLRPWGSDLAGKFRARSDEAYLALLMLSLTGFHGLTMTAVWRDVVGWIELEVGVGPTMAFTIGMTALIIAPCIVYAALVGLSRALAGDATIRYRDYFIRYAYALLPIALFYHLAHNSEHLFMEGQKVVSLASDPFGWGWNLFNTADWTLAPLASLSTLWLVQVLFVLIGHVYSLSVARHIATHLFADNKAILRSQAPMLAAMILFSVMSLWLLKQPMEMRASAM